MMVMMIMMMADSLQMRIWEGWWSVLTCSFVSAESISYWWAPAVLLWGCLLPWLMVYSHLCKLPLKLVFAMFSWSTMIIFIFLELTEEDCFGPVIVFHPCDITSPLKLHLKQDGLYSGGGGWLLLTSLFAHLMPRIEHKRCWWNHSSSLICFL